MSQALDLIGAIGAGGWTAYLMSSLIIRIFRDFTSYDPPPALRTIRMELKPFSLALLLADYLPGIATDPGPWRYIGFALGLWCWHFYRHDKDDDDRWKRRKRKLAQKAAEVGGRLVLVPAGSPP